MLSHEAFRLSNDVRAHLVCSGSTEAVTVLVLCRVGSRYEPSHLAGASHLIEHMLFKGTRRWPTALEISRQLDAIGAEYNAYTDKDVTGYYVKADASHLPLAARILSEMLWQSRFAPHELARERGVVLEEIKMYQDHPAAQAEMLLEEMVFEGNALGREIAGSPETVRSLRCSDLLAFHRRAYQPGRLVVAVAGKVDQRARAVLEQAFGKKQATEKDLSLFSPFIPLTGGLRIRAKHRVTEQAHLAIGFSSFALSDPRHAATKLLAVLLGGTASSRLFLSVREKKGLAYSIRASQTPYEDTGLFAIQAGLEKTRFPLALRTIFGELRAVRKHGVTAEELRRAKGYLRGTFLLALEDSSDQAAFFARRDLFLGQAESPEAFLRRIERVRLSDVQRTAADIFQPDRMRAIVVGSYRTDAEASAVFPLSCL
ncbi:MAG TPA: pitrilysin family protein [Patescibacteria group bacterium]|nr:pitrilysin family protein [Patescibacteria group bacterium]